MVNSFHFRHAPLKVLYTLFSITTLFVKLPGWFLLYTFPSARHKHSWSYRRALVVSVIQHLLQGVAV